MPVPHCRSDHDGDDAGDQQDDLHRVLVLAQERLCRDSFLAAVNAFGPYCWSRLDLGRAQARGAVDTLAQQRVLDRQRVPGRPRSTSVRRTSAGWFRDVLCHAVLPRFSPVAQ